MYVIRHHIKGQAPKVVDTAKDDDEANAKAQRRNIALGSKHHHKDNTHMYTLASNLVGNDNKSIRIVKEQVQENTRTIQETSTSPYAAFISKQNRYNRGEVSLKEEAAVVIDEEEVLNEEDGKHWEWGWIKHNHSEKEKAVPGEYNFNTLKDGHNKAVAKVNAKTPGLKWHKTEVEHPKKAFDTHSITSQTHDDETGHNWLVSSYYRDRKHVTSIDYGS